MELEKTMPDDALIERPDCDHCGLPYYRHPEASGFRMCPVSAFAYRPKAAPKENVASLSQSTSGAALADDGGSPSALADVPTQSATPSPQAGSGEPSEEDRELRELLSEAFGEPVHIDATDYLEKVIAGTFCRQPDMSGDQRRRLMTRELHAVQDAAAGIKRALAKARALSPTDDSRIGDVDEGGWLLEESFGPHIHYVYLKPDALREWRKTHRDESIDDLTENQRLAMLFGRTKDANEGLRFARKEDAETFIATFERAFLHAKAVEHMWHDTTRLAASREGGETSRRFDHLELTEDGLSLRTPFDGDVDGEGRHIIVGGAVLATFEDSDEGAALRDFVLAVLASPAPIEGENPATLRDLRRAALSVKTEVR